MAFNVSIDPGMSTGIAIWQNGGLIKTLTVRAPAKRKPATKKREAVEVSDSDRIIALKRGLEAVFTELYDAVPGSGNPVARVAIETFGNHNSKFGASRMILCGQARAIAVAVADSYCEEIMDITKGNRPKTEAEMFARVFGVSLAPAQEHERDALHLGIIAGFDKRKAS